MTESTLPQRIRAEFDARARRVRQSEEAHAKEALAREKRMAKFTEVCESLHSVVQPRIEEFARAFAEQAKVTPMIAPAERTATVEFLTDLANVSLTMRMAPDPDVTKLVLEYDLLILPMYFQYDRYSRLEMSLDEIDRDVVTTWLDDRIISCVKVYLAIQDNEYYLRRAMVEDPISKARFRREDAAAAMEHNGQKLYFKTAGTLEQYRQKHQIEQSLQQTPDALQNAPKEDRPQAPVRSKYREFMDQAMRDYRAGRPDEIPTRRPH